MGEASKIEWTDHTFNPWIGCTKVSPGCDHCYAEAYALRYGKDVWGPGKARQLTSDSNWKQPLKWNRMAEAAGVRYRVFCASLADVFDNEVPEEWRVRLWGLIYATPHLDWLILTKRIGNAEHRLPLGHFHEGPLANLWIGISVVNQEEADRDIPKLLAVPAKVRFLSMEPLLGSVDLSHIEITGNKEFSAINSLTGSGLYDVDGNLEASTCEFPTIDWVIIGGESGHNARPMHPDWARSLRDQCRAEGVPFFFKQWGEWSPGCRAGLTKTSQENLERDGEWKILPPDGRVVHRVGKKKAGRQLDGREWNEYPQGSKRVMDKSKN